MDAEVSEHNKK
jgi:hypothetical protein